MLLRPEIPVLSVPGDMWNVQYRFGSAVQNLMPDTGVRH